MGYNIILWIVLRRVVVLNACERIARGEEEYVELNIVSTSMSSKE